MNWLFCVPGARNPMKSLWSTRARWRSTPSSAPFPLRIWFSTTRRAWRWPAPFSKTCAGNRRPFSDSQKSNRICLLINIYHWSTPERGVFLNSNKSFCEFVLGQGSGRPTGWEKFFHAFSCVKACQFYHSVLPWGTEITLWLVRVAASAGTPFSRTFSRAVSEQFSADFFETDLRDFLDDY